MKPKQITLALALALAVGALATGCERSAAPAPVADSTAAGQADAAHPPAATDAAAAHDHGHAVEHAAGVDFPVPDGHVQWQPDAPLVEGMSRVRTAISDLRPSADAATVQARAADIDAAVEYMFENCSLPVEPDVALHAVLARLMAATGELKANPADLSPVHDMHAAMANYQALFNDPDAG